VPFSEHIFFSLRVKNKNTYLVQGGKKIEETVHWDAGDWFYTLSSGDGMRPPGFPQAGSWRPAKRANYFDLRERDRAKKAN
jgi:hypothetical protein